MPFVGSFFLRIVSQSHEYTRLSGTRAKDAVSSTRLKRTKSEDIGTRSDLPQDESAEISSLLSESTDGLEDLGEELDGPDTMDVRGLAVLKHAKFYQLWCFLGLMTGIGLMTIK